MKIPTLSIILPVYNKGKYVKRCIESILCQNFTSFELIIINDGSTDDSEYIIKEYEDERIRYYHTTNNGVSNARNLGLDVMKGEYILFIDADDWIESYYLKHIISVAECNKACVYIWGITKERNGEPDTVILPVMNGCYHQAAFLKKFVHEQYLIRRGLYGYISNKLLRSSIVKQHNLRFNTNLKLSEDYDFFLSYYKCCETAYVFSYSGYHYVEHFPQIKKESHKDIYYPSLIDIHLKCYKLLCETASLTKQNKNILFETIGNLVQASFLEMRPVSIKKIKFLILQLDKKQYTYASYKMLRTKYTLLRFLISNKKIELASLYLTCRWIYIRIYTKFANKIISR